MQYMLIFQEPMSEFANRTDPATATTHMAAWGAYIGALHGAGVVINGHGLMAPQMGTTIRVRDGKLVGTKRLHDPNNNWGEMEKL